MTRLALIGMKTRKSNKKSMMNANDMFNQYNQPYQNYPGVFPQYRQRRRSSGGCLGGCVLMILVIGALGAGVLYFFSNPLPRISPPVMEILIASAVPVALVVFVLLFIHSRRRGKGFLSSIVGSLFALALCGGGIVALIYGVTLAFPEVDMTRTAFVQTSIDASSGAHVHFVNPSNGVEQVLCIGFNGHCMTMNGAPGELSGVGLRIKPGQTVTVMFDNSGDFPVTSKIMPGMNMTIHVQEQDNSGGE